MPRPVSHLVDGFHEVPQIVVGDGVVRVNLQRSPQGFFLVRVFGDVSLRNGFKKKKRTATDEQNGATRNWLKNFTL